jgi:hypothetical protein
MLVELTGGDQQAGVGGQFWFDAPPQLAEAVKIVGAQRRNRRAATPPDDDQSFSLQTAQCFADGDEAHPELSGKIAQRERLAWS